jgi:pectin methylesterase-like acyl-CoA thioesterase
MTNDERFDRLELEMADIRNRMEPDMSDLRQQIEPDTIKEKAKQTLKERLQALLASLKANLDRQKDETVEAAERQFELVQDAARNGGDFSKVQDAVKSDPRPMIALAVGLAVTLFVLRRIARIAR